MFHNIPPSILAEMQRLEQIDARDRTDGTPRLQRLRQIPPETGQVLALLTANAPKGEIIEIGTSAGYSTLWLALACLPTGRKITTFEVLTEKARLACETFASAKVESLVELIVGDACTYLPDYRDIAFCFLDTDKEIYGECYQAVIPNLVSGGLLVDDNAINHQTTLEPVIQRARQDERVDVLVLPVGKGLLVCRKT